MRKIINIGIVVFVAIMAFAGFNISKIVLAKPATDEHMARLAMIAEEAHKSGFEYVAPDDITVSSHDGTIYVYSKSINQLGQVELKTMPNGDFSVVCDRQEAKATGAAIIFSVMCACGVLVGSGEVLKLVTKRKKSD